MNKRRKFLFASVLAVQNSNFIYPSCQRCFSKIIPLSKRFTCPKCGSSGDTGSTNYRYKLSLKVAESSKLFFITVFGSCLDTFFGLTATGLHRYLEDSIKNLETLDSGRTQSLLTTAVEKCFVGQSFVFGVTRSSAFSLSSLKPEETANPSQNSDSLIWDDLPLSESLNKFLAVVESEVAVTEIDAKNRKQGMDKSIDKCHKNYSRLSLTPEYCD